MWLFRRKSRGEWRPAWAGRFGALSVRPAVVLEARAAAELDEAIGAETVRPFVRARLGPSVVEVAAAQALELASSGSQRRQGLRARCRTSDAVTACAWRLPWIMLQPAR